ncbi:MAG: CYTH and CHAD domain-containing protein [Alphaproteobacteria bacterium]|jgi:inorganic triphosphatase YgiF|nr:CYTH and CHAD domain-containing protein [Alphaproteobacteria bacterium]
MRTRPPIEPSVSKDPSAAVPTEIELKLALDPKDLDRLRQSETVQRLSTDEPSEKRLTSIYYDTDEKRLMRRGLSFRVRSDGRRFIQTVKSSGSNIGGLSKRGEWEIDVDSLEPRPELVPDPAVRARIGLVLPGGLKPLFETRIDRREIVAHEPQGDSLISLALDSGEVRAGSRTRPISEIEFELVRGQNASLYRMALEVLDVVPLRIEPRSKAARGYVLVSGEAAEWRKAEPLSLHKRETVEGAMNRIFQSCVGHWSDNQAAVLDGGEPEAVHQFRVGLRRFRSALVVFARVLPTSQTPWLRDEARWTIRETGPARDWDVFIDELLAPVVEACPDDASLVMLRQRAELERRSAYARVHALLRSERYTRFMLQLGAWLETQGWQDHVVPRQRADLAQPISGFAARLLAKRHKRALKLGKNFAGLTTDERHAVRIALKKLRYASEFFATLFPAKRVAPYLESLRDMQNDLGHLNDVATAERLLGGICPRHADPGLARACGLVIGWYARMVRENEGTSLRDWSAFRDSAVFWSKARKRS